MLCSNLSKPGPNPIKIYNLLVIYTASMFLTNVIGYLITNYTNSLLVISKKLSFIGLTPQFLVKNRIRRKKGNFNSEPFHEVTFDGWEVNKTKYKKIFGEKISQQVCFLWKKGMRSSIYDVTHIIRHPQWPK